MIMNQWTGRPWCECMRLGCPGGIIRFKFHFRMVYEKRMKKIKAWFRSFTDLDYSKIEDVEVDGIDGRDAPDFCDAFICSATYKGREMTEAELERLNEDSDYVYQKVIDHIY